jgi:hypothetical protein
MTKGQRLILAALTLGTIATISLLIWSVWSTMQAGPPALPPTPTTQALSLPTSTPTPPLTETPAPTLIPTFDVAEAGQIAAEVSEIRGFQGFWGTPLTLVDQYNLSVALYRYFERYPPFVTQYEIIWDALNLHDYDPDRTQNSLSTALDVVAHAENTAAVYFPETEEFYFRKDWSGALDVLETQLVYGYARALPDQYGNITELIAEASSLDRRLALSAVADGDALLTLWLYADVEPNTPRAAQLADMIAAGTIPTWRESEPTFEDLMRLPLNLGGSFAASVVEQGGLEALDKVIVRPPRSTEQVLHIDRYLNGDEPKVLMPVEPSLDRNWTLLATETLGEAMVGFTMADWSLNHYSMQVAENWGGDLLQVWASDDGAELVLWQLVWDSSSDAATFYGNLLDLLPRPLLRGIVRDTTPSAGLPRGRWWAGGQGAVFIHRLSNRIVLIWGTSEAAVEAAAAALN